MQLTTQTQPRRVCPHMAPSRQQVTDHHPPVPPSQIMLVFKTPLHTHTGKEVTGKDSSEAQAPAVGFQTV